MASAAIRNPKRRRSASTPASWYTYYAGFSESFVFDVLSQSHPSDRYCQWVLDPWNGTGTTAAAAASLGLNALGYDLNPVMVVVSKARCLDSSAYAKLQPLALEVCKRSTTSFQTTSDDALTAWLCPDSVAAIRGVEAAIQKLLVDEKQYRHAKDRGVDEIPDIAAFFYVVLFRTVKRLLRPFRASNPTWIKRPGSPLQRLRPRAKTIREIFKGELDAMLPKPLKRRGPSAAMKSFKVASSENIPLPDGSVDFVLSSPPYCTRIDYAMATWPELAVLGLGRGAEFEQLRRQLTGTATVPPVTPLPAKNFGGTCLRFLEDLRTHGSKASDTYYYKNHLQYFCSVAASFSEISRVLKRGGKCVLVVQDSYYKDLHNDLPAIFAEMGETCGLSLQERVDFQVAQTMAAINPRANEYRESFRAVESVLSFTHSAASRTQ